MNLSAIRSFVIRHKVSITDLSLLFLFMLVATFYAFEVDIFANEGTVTVHEETIELDEALLLGGLLALGLLIFAARRYAEQKRETRRRMAAERLARELAYQDVLTGLPNRRQFDDALKAAIDAPPRAGAAHAVFLLDLNGFKQINDVHGHGVGDQVLIVVAERLLGAMRDGDMVARFGGDEFAILARHLAGAEAATNLALRVIEALATPVSSGDVQHMVGVGIGIALLPADAATPGEALRKADVALYRAKAEKRSALRFFEQQMDHHVLERDRMERDLRAALGADMIHAVFQPTFDLRTHQVVGFEAMPNWVHPTEGEIAPERFIAIAEEVGLILDLSDRILREACTAAVAWPPDIRLAIDLVPSQLRDKDLAGRMIAILSQAGLAPDRLEVEITESALVADMEAAQQVLGALRAAGVRISLDNFGTGYSSLYHLRNIKLDKIKIDRSFIDAMESEEQSAAIVSALVGLGHGLGLVVSAEGIDDRRQERSLLDTGCEEGQGDVLGARIDADATLRFFAVPESVATAPAPQPISDNAERLVRHLPL